MARTPQPTTTATLGRMSSTAAAVTRSEKPPAMASTSDMLLRRVAARWAMENVAMVAFRARSLGLPQWSHIAKALGPTPPSSLPGTGGAACWGAAALGWPAEARVDHKVARRARRPRPAVHGARLAQPLWRRWRGVQAEV